MAKQGQQAVADARRALGKVRRGMQEGDVQEVECQVCYSDTESVYTTSQRGLDFSQPKNWKRIPTGGGEPAVHKIETVVGDKRVTVQASDCEEMQGLAREPKDGEVSQGLNAVQLDKVRAIPS
jgi:hypothetical protein